MNAAEIQNKLNKLISKPAENKKGVCKRVHIWISSHTFMNIDSFLLSSEFEYLKLKRKGERYAILFGPLGQFADIFEGQKGYIYLKLIKGD